MACEWQVSLASFLWDVLMVSGVVGEFEIEMKIMCSGK